MSDELIELPEGWVWSTLGELGEWSSGGTPLRKNAEYYGGQIPWVKTGNLPDGLIKEIDEKITQKGLVNSSAKLFPNGSLIVAMYGATIGKLGILNEPAATNQACAVLLSKGITTALISYIFYYLLGSREDLRMIGQGGAQPNISQAILKEYSCPLPPLNEQKRIVAKIEELNDRTQRAKEALEIIPQLCDRFRQSVLAAAFRGDLTADWREQNPDVETASVLLERIRIEKKQLYKKKLSETANSISLEMNHTVPLPNSWQWISFGELITSIRSGSTAVPQDEISSYPILRSSSVRSGSADLTDIRYLTKNQSENEDNFLNDGDLLFTRLSGSLEYVANCAIVRNLVNRRIQYPDRLFRAKLVDIKFSDYSELWFATPLLRSLITNYAKSTAGHQRISMTAITEAPIPLPPVVEQQKIVEIVRSFLKHITRIEERYQETKFNLDQLNQSILAKAFRGELVPQDPDDEPASELLERIRAEREKLNNGKQKSQRTSKRKSKTVEEQGV